jgi:hypothetical protein
VAEQRKSIVDGEVIDVVVKRPDVKWLGQRLFTNAGTEFGNLSG